MTPPNGGFVKVLLSALTVCAALCAWLGSRWIEHAEHVDQQVMQRLEQASKERGDIRERLVAIEIELKVIRTQQ
jgi:hypothetical protein